MSQKIEDSVKAIQRFADAIQALFDSNVIRSYRYIGEIGEWYIEQLYGFIRVDNLSQKGFDMIHPDTNERIQVKTQRYDPKQAWGYIKNLDYFDRLIVITLNNNLTIHDLYDLPMEELKRIVRVESTTKKFSYHWVDLKLWRKNPQVLNGAQNIFALLERP